ncbi:exodeoxyribonuclease VII large subunit [Thermosulfurimonas sp. F29]|uniref:exodeoxyribonuclease VII large subunit n=1 Tax=Thermosulfurimonas sp. F29 TaxID=2867247 RepID=UPI001C838059|nr:exodeoxyribonuclease VII large subunit [Thermosulfurimonas sp. F29]MBX6424177.1 hypothetical protein [Thermosulfurimonas sp. F29]
MKMAKFARTSDPLEKDVDPPFESGYYLPGDILERVASAGAGGLVRVRGFLERCERTNYDCLAYAHGDEEARVTLTGEALREAPEGAYLEVVGFLRVYPYGKGGALYPRIEVRDLRVLDPPSSSEETRRRTELFELARNRSFRPLQHMVRESFERLGALTVGIIHGRGAQTHRDFESGFYATARGAFAERVAFLYREVVLASDEELARAIREMADRVEAIFIVRGGGGTEDLARVGGYASAKAALEARCPVYVALGHSLDRGVSLLEKVCDGTFHTPSLAGAELGLAVASHEERTAFNELQEKTRLQHGEIESLKEALRRLEVDLKRSRRLNRVLEILLALGAVVAIALFHSARIF